MIRLLIADSRPVVREGLKRIVSECADMAFVTEAGNPPGVLDFALTAEADVLVLGEVSALVPETLELLRELKRRRPKLRVLVLGAHDDDQIAVRVLRAGAVGYLAQSQPAVQLLEAIRRVAGGRRYLGPTLAQKLVFDLEVSDRRRHHGLSDREYQVVRMFGSGKAFKTIASELGVSPKTVSTYRSRILQKLRLRTNADMIRYAIENRLVQ
jgi:two-component system, NarL family, invasion response regulator UvrY